MNNSQFRKLLFDKSGRKDDDASPTAPTSSLGGKKSGFMPMTPRTVKGGSDVDFARQVRERNAALQPTKKFKSSAPKGSKFGAGYTDRAKARAEAEEVEDDKAERIKALEEQMKLGQIAPELFESLRDKIAGGDVSSTHLVRGLDRKLLERVKRGEKVFEGPAQEEEPVGDVDDELDKFAGKDVEAVKREKAEKKGSMAGRKRTRDEIMAELKAQRAAAKEASKVVLDDSKWKRVGEASKAKVEIDHKGREVLITVDEDGNVKKKVRKVQAAPVDDVNEPPKTVLGADVVIPESAPTPTPDDEDDDDDIFENVGAEYNPLGDDDSDLDGQEEVAKARPAIGEENKDATTAKESRNYFNDKPKEEEAMDADRQAGIENIIKKAAKMDASRAERAEDDESDEEKRARLKKRAQMLAQEDRDLEDMDMGFGSSRYEDEEEGGEDSKIRLSQWKGSADQGDDEPQRGGKGGDKKKRNPKKRKGDVNNAADIMRVIEGRKSAGK